MSDPYPLPVTAVYAWLAGEAIMIGLPPTEGHTHGHTIAIPLRNCSIEVGESGTTLSRQRGWESLLRLLQARATAKVAPKIGEQADITQAQIDAFLRAARLRRAEAKLTKMEKAQAKLPLRQRKTTIDDLGDLEDLEIV